MSEKIDLSITKEQAEADARRANKRLAEIRDAERREENKALVGKTFKYRNCYSCPDGPDDYWWLYAKVQKMDDQGLLEVFTFETDLNDNRFVRTDQYRHNMNDGYQPIRPSDFDRAWRAFQSAIAATKP